MKVAVSQSNYIPWMGFFELIRSVDKFILLDDVQYTRRDWRNRNKIRTKRGDVWLTIPLKQDGNYYAKINEMEVSDPIWDRRHFDTIRQAYLTAKCWKEYQDDLEWCYIDAPANLSLINRRFLDLGCQWLGIETPLKWSTDYRGHEGLHKSDKLIALCKACGADVYLSGPAAKAYLDEKKFNDNGIAVEWMQYSDWPKLSFLHGVLNGLERG